MRDRALPLELGRRHGGWAPKILSLATRISGVRHFDSSYRRGKPAIIRPNDVIAGWREALALMRPGAEWRLFIPPDLAYALTPPPSIPPNALLIFDVSMIGVEPAGTPHAAAPGSRPAPASVSVSATP
jgi:FKBP-type peptidyl-prolyl cis-trans isomerase